MLELLGHYRESLKGDRRHLFDGYRFVEMARKVVGVGSVGTRAWVALMMGRDGQDPLFLQAKEAEASVLEPYLGESEFGNHGERVVEGQWLMQAASDILLGWLPALGSTATSETSTFASSGTGSDRSRSTTLPPEGLAIYGRVCGWTLARAHARSGDRIAIGVLPWQGREVRPRDRRSSRERYADQTSSTTAARGRGQLGRIEVETDLSIRVRQPRSAPQPPDGSSSCPALRLGPEPAARRMRNCGNAGDAERYCSLGLASRTLASSRGSLHPDFSPAPGSGRMWNPKARFCHGRSASFADARRGARVWQVTGRCRGAMSRNDQFIDDRRRRSPSRVG